MPGKRPERRRREVGLRKGMVHRNSQAAVRKRFLEVGFRTQFHEFVQTVIFNYISIIYH